MTEWWTYRPTSFLLFSPRTYLRLHELYNADIWPLQLVGLALGAAMTWLLWRAGTSHGRFIALGLAACWAFTAIAFHLLRYATINWAATYFAGAFAVEALLLAWMGIGRRAPTFAAAAPVYRRAGFWLLVFALVAQPLAGVAGGRRVLQSEWFGVAPDPTAVATLGVLLLADRIPWTALVIPLGWCVVSGTFAWAMRAPDALVMPLAGFAAALCALRSLAVRRTRAA
jgi:hypothetical protein